MENENADIRLKHKDFLMQYKGSALCFLILACVAGIVWLCTHCQSTTALWAGILPLSVGLYQLIALLAATLGFRLKE